MTLNKEDIFHALARAGFGGSYDSVRQWLGRSSEDLAEYLLKQTKEIEEFAFIKSDDPSLSPRKGLSKDDRDKIERNSRLSQIELNKVWLAKMIKSDSGYGEKLSLFWHDHFATRIFNPWFVQKQINTFRSLGTGPFKNLLLAMIADPAMLIFLNNQQNRVGAINENFAREFLELFTIGRGNYTESDIKEAARALTGWRTDLKGNSRFEARLFDNTEKTIFGKSGNYNAEKLVDLVLSDKRTAKFLAAKFYGFYISESPDEDLINTLADYYYKENYHTGKLLQYIFSSDFFYQSKNRGARIKSPIELLVGIYRLVPVRFEGDDPNVNLQKLMGQVLLFPPGVAGWSWAKAWIDSSTLLFRLELPTKILAMAAVELADSGRQKELNDEAKMMGGAVWAKFKPYADWTILEKELKDIPPERREEVLSDIMLRVKRNNFLGENDIVYDMSSPKNRVLKIMALPEYQLT